MAKHELSSDKNKVILGDQEWLRYEATHKSPHMFFDAVRGRFDLPKTSWHPKEVNKILHENFGSKIPYRFGAAMYNTFIKANLPYETHFAVRGFGLKWKTYIPQLVNEAVTYNYLVQQAVRDNTVNLLPLMLKKKMDTQQLKSLYGKGLWKKLANTSKSRMKYLALVIDHNPEWADIRTCILDEVRGYAGWDDSEILAAKVAPKAGTYRRTHHLIQDTQRMARQLGEEVNRKWSLKRWNEEHDRMTKEVTAKKYSSNDFAEVVVYEEGPYTFTLLTNQRDIAIEGTVMKHCVASYAMAAARGNYAVFKVEGKERATLGLRKPTGMGSTMLGMGLYFDQCYGQFNSMVSEELREAAYKVVDKHNDYLRLRDGRVSGSGDQDPRSVVDLGWQGVPVNQQLRRDAIPPVLFPDIDWA
jgi:PcfJ-like protein